jgi:drug/metabolite transporter (DMT)-like permease
MLPDDPIKAIVLAVSATVLFGSSDTISKYLSGSLPIVEFIWIRYVLFLITAVCLVRRRSILPRNPGLQITRGLCVVGSSILFVYGVRQMTMAQATTISFLSPLLITILSIPLLGETVGPRRWAAVGVGMLGMLVVVRPGLGGFQPAALFGVASAFCWALALIITRKISNSDTPQTTVLWSAGIGIAVLSLILPFQAIWPTPKQLGLSLVLGVLASGGQWAVVLAHRIAPASLLAPFFYSQLLWVSVLGFLVFGNLPDIWTIVGAAIIAASGLYTAHRERVRRQERRRVAPGR